jgi:hypothetical protein
VLQENLEKKEKNTNAKPKPSMDYVTVQENLEKKEENTNAKPKPRYGLGRFY